jgi:hypothetical protein
MYNSSIEWENYMWEAFSDYELATLCFEYGIESELKFGNHFNLDNRVQVEQALTEYEMNLAFED